MTESGDPEGPGPDDLKAALNEPITATNCGEKLRFVRVDLAKVSRRKLATVLGVSEATLRRIEDGTSSPSTEFMARLEALCLIGASRFKKMSAAERDQVAELLGGAGGVAAGVAGSVGAVGAAGFAGFSAAGITSGLAAIGGGTMLAGVGVVAAIPVVAGLAGYSLVKGIKKIVDANGLVSEEVDGKWEIRNPGNEATKTSDDPRKAK